MPKSCPSCRCSIATSVSRKRDTFSLIEAGERAVEEQVPYLRHLLAASHIPSPDTPHAAADMLEVGDVDAERDLLARRLLRQGHRVEMAENGQEAVDKLQQGAWDRVLFDERMPILDGVGVLTAIKRCERTRAPGNDATCTTRARGRRRRIS
ncbi:response regulator [Gemmatimonas sp.]|uniref:response regulator n=1 Tax=Gemmatimonas sp. TaxID=1962908 RepID=UPI003DA51CD5